MIERDMACAFCTYALNAIDDNDTVTFEHPVTPASGDHDPVPVPAHQLDTVYRRCHLCSLNPPVWMYQTPQIEAMSYGGTHPVTETYSTQWHVCCPCSHLIEQDDHVALTRRAIAAVGWRPTDPRAQILAGMHRAIVLTRETGRTLLTTGEYDPAQLKASTLPKVRDRLVGLLRGRVGLPAPLDHAEPRRLLADGLEHARLYWIDPQFTALVTQLWADLPHTETTDRIVPGGSGLLLWSSPVDQRHRVAGASWIPRPDGWQLVCYRSLGLDLPPTVMEAVRHEVGWLVPIHVVHVPHGLTINGDSPLGALVATWLIIAQQLTRDEPTRVDPPIRKAYARAHRPPPEVRLVSIKPTSHQSRPPATEQDRSPSGRAQPDHRYWVSGHPRNQAYGPGRSLRKKIDIDPYLKGPDEAPIKPSTTVRVLGSARARPTEDDNFTATEI